MSDLLSPETRERRRGMLWTALGPAIALALEEAEVVEVIVNPDGRLWLERHRAGRADTGVILTPQESERIIRLVASHVRAEASASYPIISLSFPKLASGSKASCRRSRSRRALPSASLQRRRFSCPTTSGHRSPRL